MKKSNFKVIIFYSVLILLVILASTSLFNMSAEDEMKYSEIIALFEKDQVKKFTVSADGDLPIAFGGPIAGTSRIYKDVQAPIRAIVYLHQGSENQLTFLDRRHAFMALYSQAVKSSHDAAFNESLIPLIQRIIEAVPVADYFCQPNASAVEYLRDRLKHIPSDLEKARKHS